MSDIRPFTIEELAEDAFLKNEVLQAHLAMSTPNDFESRKLAFIELAKARDAANKATRALEARLNASPPREGGR